MFIFFVRFKTERKLQCKSDWVYFPQRRLQLLQCLELFREFSWRNPLKLYCVILDIWIWKINLDSHFGIWTSNNFLYICIIFQHSKDMFLLSIVFFVNFCACFKLDLDFCYQVILHRPSLYLLSKLTLSFTLVIMEFTDRRKILESINVWRIYGKLR